MPHHARRRLSLAVLCHKSVSLATVNEQSQLILRPVRKSLPSLICVRLTWPLWYATGLASHLDSCLASVSRWSAWRHLCYTKHRKIRAKQASDHRAQL